METDRRSVISPIIECPVFTLGLAAQLAKFGLAFTADRAPQTVLDSGTTWCVPFAAEARLPDLPAEPLLADMPLDFLVKIYSAPVRKLTGDPPGAQPD